jgi:DNA-binding NtrC family response regulator
MLADLAKLLDDSAAPVYVLDEDHRIVYCNAACARWTGLPADELLGQQCGYHTPLDGSRAAAVAAGLCPPPKVFAGEMLSAQVSIVAPDGTLLRRRGHFVPLADGEDECAEVLAILDTHDAQDAAVDGAVSVDNLLHDQLRALRASMAARFRLDSLLGNSPAMQRIRSQVELAAGHRAHVMVVGPRGSGKEHAARTIHYSRDKSGTLVPLDCATLEPNLLRSTLRAIWFRQTSGKDASIDVVLNHVDAMPLDAQADLIELLRFTSPDVRVISTSERPLADGHDEFSRDLACALTTMIIDLPPLGRRIEDLPLLAQHFLEQCNVGTLKQVGGWTSEALDRLTAHDWHGNVDELAEIVARCHEAAQGGEVTAQDLPDEIRWSAEAASRPVRRDEAIVLPEFLAKVEIELITRALRRAKGNKSKAARLLGLTRPRLYRRLVQLGLEKPEDNKPGRAE